MWCSVQLFEQVGNRNSFLQPLSFTILTLCCCFVFFLLVMKWSPYGNRKKQPPSPPRLPIIGNLHQLGLHPHRSLRTLAQTHGPLMLLHFGSVPVLVVSSADIAREVMRTHDLVFANRPKSSIFKKLLYNHKDVSMAPYGEYWRQMKSISTLHLLSAKRVHSFRNVREEKTACMIDKVKEWCSSSPSQSSSVNLSEIFSTLTNDVVCRVALGKKYSGKEGGTKFKKLLGEFVELLGVVNVGDYIPWLAWMSRVNGLDERVEKVAKEFDDFLESVVEEHTCRHNGEVQNEDKKDFVDVLLQIQRDNATGFPIDRISIKALILDAFAAGTDTTYTVIEWAMTELLRHPEVMKKVQNEVRKIAGDKLEITEDELDKLHYLKAVIKETLRLHPPIPLLVPRESTQDVRLKGFDIKAGTQVVVNAWAIGRDPVLWGHQAEEFLPERFLLHGSSIDFKGHDFELIPFGAGRRGCPGIQFAISIVELVLANLLCRFDWSLPDGGSEEYLDMPESSGITIHRKFPLLAVPTLCSF